MNQLMSQLALDEELKALIEDLLPADEEQRKQVLRNVVNRSGGFERDAILPYLPTLKSRWRPGETDPDYIPQVSQIVRFVARASAPPTTGNCIVTLSVETPGSGITPIGTVTILQGQLKGETGLSYDVPGGSWLFASVTTPNGATGVTSAAAYRLL
jgi:hypothetical protein